MAKEATEYQKGERLDITLTADVSVGDVIPLGTMIGVAASAGLTGEVIAVEVEKVWTITAKDADEISIGTELYWDDTNKYLTVTDTDNTYAGKSVSAKAAATAGTVNIKINVG